LSARVEIDLINKMTEAARKKAGIAKSKRYLEKNRGKVNAQRRALYYKKKERINTKRRKQYLKKNKIFKRIFVLACQCCRKKENLSDSERICYVIKYRF